MQPREPGEQNGGCSWLAKSSTEPVGFVFHERVLRRMLSSAQFEGCLQRELKSLEEQQAGFEADFSAAEFTEAVAGWNDKIQRAGAGEQRWGLFTARKP